jgi:surface antigen
VPTRTYFGNSGQPCRDFTTRASIDGRNQTIYGTACRQPDGSWQTMGS